MSDRIPGFFRRTLDVVLGRHVPLLALDPYLSSVGDRRVTLDVYQRLRNGSITRRTSDAWAYDPRTERLVIEGNGCFLGDIAYMRIAVPPQSATPGVYARGRI